MAIKQLSSEHYEAIALLAVPKRGGLTYEEIADRINVHVNTLYYWRLDPVFQAAFKQEVVRRTHERLSEVFDAMIDTAVKDGNAAAAKLILSTNGMLTDKVEVTTNTSEGKSIEDIQARIAQFKKGHTAE